VAAHFAVESATTASATGRPGSHRSPHHKCGKSDRQRHHVDCTKLAAERQQPFGKIAPAARDPKQGWQLGERDGRRKFIY